MDSKSQEITVGTDHGEARRRGESNRKAWVDNVSEGWRTFHRLALALSQAIQSGGNREVVLNHLGQAIAPHRNLDLLKTQRDEFPSPRKSELRDSMPLEWATDDIFDVMMALLHSLGKQLDLWGYKFEASARFAKYRVVLFTRADEKRLHVFTLGSDSDAAILAAAWRTLLEDSGRDVQLEGISTNGRITLLPARKIKRRNG